MRFRYVYILRSKKYPDRHYTGLTDTLEKRLCEHNQGKCSHTAKFVPWEVKTAIAFADFQKAVDFEKYLKSASGKAFAKKRL